MKTGIRAAWRIAKPYWVSEDRWPARGLLATVIGIDLIRVYTAIWITYWQSDFLDALAAFDAAKVWQLLLYFLIPAGAGVILDTARPWFNQRLEMRWRNWATGAYLDRWLSQNNYYRLDSDHLIDNPDQRIADDLRLMASDTLTLLLGFIQNLTNLISYSAVVWGLSGSLAFAIGGVHLSIPGYLLWAALIYGVAGSLLLEKFGKPMVAVDYRQQEREARFRFLMVRLRESAEQIAFYSGADAERRRLGIAFQAVRQNWGEVMRYTKRVTFFKEAHIEVGAYVAHLLILPRYFSKEMTLGMMQQSVLTFSRVRASFGWFINFYKELALLRSVYARLIEFDAALNRPAESGIGIAHDPGHQLVVEKLRLGLADGSPLLSMDGLRIASGERWLLSGDSGVGKSTLLRAFAGLWTHGEGRVALPEGDRMFVHQRSYLPAGSLRECLCYPSGPEAFDAHACTAALADVRLEGLAGKLDEVSDWAKRLSPGEQQRLAFARVLLHRPGLLFLDEATSALDADNEANLYRMVIEQLPTATVVSVAHRESLRGYHTHSLVLRNGAGRAAPLAQEDIAAAALS